jgi:hypothetical protein
MIDPRYDIRRCVANAALGAPVIALVEVRTDVEDTVAKGAEGDGRVPDVSFVGQTYAEEAEVVDDGSGDGGG